MGFWRRLFKRRAPSPGRGQDTAVTRVASADEVAAVSTRQRISIGSAQSTGKERSHNEDTLFVLKSTSEGDDTLPDFAILIVADGMGGHHSGEIASAVSARTVASQVVGKIYLELLGVEPPNAHNPLMDVMRLALEEANQEVVQRVPGGGTTLTAAVLLGDQITVGHVGDSRAYIITEESIKSITRDHSYVARLIELGKLTEEEAVDHPQKNVLYRAIGQGDSLEIDVFTEQAPRAGYLLLCSDGLWGVVSDEVIQQTVLNASDPQEACAELVQAANHAGGPDNITAILTLFP